MQKVKFKRLHPDAVIPKYATPGSGSQDLVVTKVEMDGPNKVTYYFGFATAIPEGYIVTFKPRSSFTHKGWVMQNSPAEIDSDFRGEWRVKFEAIPDGATYNSMEFDIEYPDMPYEVGDRAVQCKLEKRIDFEFEEVEDLDETQRGTGGFGSSDKKVTVEKDAFKADGKPYEKHVFNDPFGAGSREEVKLNDSGKTEVYINGTPHGSQG